MLTELVLLLMAAFFVVLFYRIVTVSEWATVMAAPVGSMMSVKLDKSGTVVVINPVKNPSKFTQGSKVFVFASPSSPAVMPTAVPIAVVSLAVVLTISAMYVANSSRSGMFMPMSMPMPVQYAQMSGIYA